MRVSTLRRSPPRGLVVLRLTYEDVMTGREPVLALIVAAVSVRRAASPCSDGQRAPRAVRTRGPQYLS